VSATISIDERGLATLDIRDAQGEAHSYTVRPAPPGLASWAVELERLDTAAKYRVAVYALATVERWQCSCPDYLYRRGKDQPRGCKHTRACAGLRALILSLSGAEHDRISEAGA
jgi:hypothetical protein